MIPQILSDQQAALNLFVLKWGWQIDHSRLEHYLAMSPSDRTQFKLRFDFAVKHRPSEKSVEIHFDCLTNYHPCKLLSDSELLSKLQSNSELQVNLAVAEIEWLQN